MRWLQANPFKSGSGFGGTTDHSPGGSKRSIVQPWGSVQSPPDAVPDVLQLGPKPPDPGKTALAQSAGLGTKSRHVTPYRKGGGVLARREGHHLSPCRLPLLVAPVSKGLLRLRQITGDLLTPALCCSPRWVTCSRRGASTSPPSQPCSGCRGATRFVPLDGASGGKRKTPRPVAASRGAISDRGVHVHPPEREIDTQHAATSRRSSRAY